MKIKSLPSIYRQVQFRSRLEARWAAYFDLIGMEWQYEPEGFHLDCGNYCPDFYCPKGFYIEIKPTHEERIKNEHFFKSLSKGTGMSVYCIVGPPSLNPQHHYRSDHDDYEACPGVFCHYAFTDKGWGCPYFSYDYPCWEDGIDQDLAHTAANMRFNNGVAAFNYAK